MTTYIVAIGNFFECLNLVGPFPNYDLALNYAEGEGEWTIVAVEAAPEELCPPVIFDEGEVRDLSVTDDELPDGHYLKGL